MDQTGNLALTTSDIHACQPCNLVIREKPNPFLRNTLKGRAEPLIRVVCTVNNMDPDATNKVASKGVEAAYLRDK
jgi:hypothetical protein